MRNEPAADLSPLTIQIRGGVGSGPTAPAAFDAALRNAGVGNYSLMRLSAVIPRGSSVIEPSRSEVLVDGEWGDRLYVALAEARAATPGDEAWAGIAWAQEPASGRGLFAEHEGTSRERVEADLDASLASIADAREIRFGHRQMRVVGARCEREPVCALVVAIYQADPWRGASRPTEVEMARTNPVWRGGM